MSPEVPIVDCGPFCAVGVSRTIDKSEFSHSLDPKRPLGGGMTGQQGTFY